MADIRHLLLPEDDPMLEPDYHLESASVCSNDSSSSWTTESEASITKTGQEHGYSDDRRDDDDCNDHYLYADERFVDSGWGGECLRETEDIDFDFVYALHTFVATVEGQANATKGDTMVLLDDSNSYWWLVRIVKDSTIGYLPAEHIETPTERLARLNKHRNVDLSQAMLGDNMEKSKNPLKRAIRRRNAKTVQFAAPTYVEASEYEYDTEDEDNAALAIEYANGIVAPENGTDADHSDQQETVDGAQEKNKARLSDSSFLEDGREVKPPAEEPVGAPTLVDSTEAAPLKSRKGTPRNADSFLLDESAEPRRITLTPNILRDDGSSTNSNSLEKIRSSSFDSIEKQPAPQEKSKDDKKKKEKKPGMLSGLFRSRKKDKKAGKDDDVVVESEKQSGEISRETPRQSLDRASPTLERNGMVGEKRGKLQKAAPATFPIAPPPLQEKHIPIMSAPSLSQQRLSPQVAGQPLATSEGQPSSHFFAELEGSEVAYEAPTGYEHQIRDVLSRNSTRSPTEGAPPPQLQQSSSMLALSAITNRMRPSSDEHQMKKHKVKKAKTRVELDDFDEFSDDEDPDMVRERLSESPVEISSPTFMHGTESVHIPIYLKDGDNSTQGDLTPEERISEDNDRASSPSMIDMPIDAESLDQEEGKSRSLLPATNETDSNDDDPTPIQSKSQSPERNISHPGLPNLRQSPTFPPAQTAPFPPAAVKSASSEESNARAVTPSTQRLPKRAASTSSTASTELSPSLSPVSAVGSAVSKDTTQSWSDASLRAWLDGGEGNDIRDMLVVIHDKSDVTPVAADHPLMKGLWDEERNACGRMMGELDDLLGGFLGKRSQGLGVGGVKSGAKTRKIGGIAEVVVSAPVATV